MTSTKRFHSPDSDKQIERLQKHYEAWRKHHKPRARIPIRPWNAAVQAAGECGLNRTAKALRLDYYTLKKRLDASGGVQAPAPALIGKGYWNPPLILSLLVLPEYQDSCRLRLSALNLSRFLLIISKLLSSSRPILLPQSISQDSTASRD
jgi:hypothetical protein